MECRCWLTDIWHTCSHWINKWLHSMWRLGHGFQAVQDMQQTDVVSEMTASRLVNDSPNSLTQFENDAVQVARESEIAKVKQQYPKWYQSMTPVEISEFILHGLIATPRFLLVCQHSCTRQWPKQFAVGIGLNRAVCVVLCCLILHCTMRPLFFWTRVLEGIAEILSTDSWAFNPFLISHMLRCYPGKTLQQSSCGNRSWGWPLIRCFSVWREFRVIRLRCVDSTWSSRRRRCYFGAPNKSDNWVCIHTYKRTYKHTCIHTYTHTFIHTYIDKYIHVYINTFVHANTLTYIHAPIETYINTCIYAYIHT